MTDPKDDHQTRYTTTPPDDRVGSLDRTDTPDVLPDDPGEVPGFTDKGNHPAVTRDPEEMAHSLQGAEYAGSDEPDLAQPDLPGGYPAPGVGGLGLNTVPVRNPLQDADQNPGYVPPSEDGPRELGERTTDLPEGAPGEAATDRSLGRDRDRS